MVSSVATPPSPALPSKGVIMESCSSPSFSPSSDKRFWSNLRCRIDPLLENKAELDVRSSDGDAEEEEAVENGKRLKRDTALLLRGFDSVAHTLSQLSSNIDNALQGAKYLAKPPTMTDIFQISSRTRESDAKDEDVEFRYKGKKRKLGDHTSERAEEEEEDMGKGEEGSPDDKLLKKAKNLAVSLTAKAAFLAKELKSIKSDLSFVQERCVLLEEENAMLRHGCSKGIQPEEDDLVRLQLEALLAEKFRLANENANLTRENQCLCRIVEYHQATSQDLSAAYEEEVIDGICLDFAAKPDGAHDEGERNVDSNNHTSTSAEHFEFSTILGDNCYDENKKSDR